MRHVTDGELHAYLDGALDHLPEGRGEEVRDHLASCPVCGERLQDETRIRERAQDLLETVAPPEGALPPFEELRARAEAAEDPSGANAQEQEARRELRAPLVSIPLAWAATVVLALGVGWMGSEIWSTVPAEDSRLFSGVPTELQPAGTGGEDEGSGEVAAAPDQESPQAEAAEADSPIEEAPTRGGELESIRVPATFREEARADALTPAKGTESPSPTSSETEGAFRSRTSATAAPELLDAEGMAPDHSLALPGFPVLSVEWEEWVPGERNLHIRQLLPMGDTLELRYLGMLMGTDPGAVREPGEEAGGRVGALLEHPPFPKVMEASLPPGWNQVVMRQGRGWLVARAPLKTEQLRALLRSLR